jgi:hypothetical protein
LTHRNSADNLSENDSVENNKIIPWEIGEEIENESQNFSRIKMEKNSKKLFRKKSLNL